MGQLALVLPGNNTIENLQLDKRGFVDLGSFISKLYEAIFLVAMGFAVYYLAWGVFEYIYAGGDKQKLAAARGRITWAIIGLIFVLLAFLIAQFAAQIVLPNQPGVNQPFPTLPIFQNSPTS